MTEYTEIYYSENVGISPGTDTKAYKATQATLEYLKDAGVPENKILELVETMPAKESICFEDLPEWLWEDSLLEKDIFYFHKILHITSPPPKYDLFSNKITKAKFFIEMKIQFDLMDLLDYFYHKTRFPEELRDPKKDMGAMEHLLNKYERFKTINSIDFILSLIDTSFEKQSEGYKITDVFGITSWESEVFEKLQRQIAEAKVKKQNVIRWREVD